MMGRLNCWSVYEYMRIRFMRTGAVPDAVELKREFAELPAEEIDAGAEEFRLLMGGRTEHAV